MVSRLKNFVTSWSELGQLFLDMLHFSIEKGSFISNANSAIISVLPKPNKDTSLCSNYRPLSILDTEIKAHAKIQAIRLEKIMTKLVHNDQTGFIKSRLASDNMRRLLHVIQAAKDFPSHCAVFSLDATKAFAFLEHHFRLLGIF